MANRFCLLLALCLVTVAPPGLGAVELLPHRAVYRMSLISATRGSQVVGADGAMF